MNEKIEELARQAKQYAEWITPQGLEWFDTFKEKFVELIVRECEVAMNEMPRYSRTKSFQEMENATIEDCIRTVKEHFGVE